VPLIVNSISGNTNPFDPAHIVAPAATSTERWPSSVMRIRSNCSIAPRWRRSCCRWGVSRANSPWRPKLQPDGQRIRHPMLEFNINVIGPRAQKNIPDALRYEPGFSDLLATSRCDRRVRQSQPSIWDRTAGTGASAPPSSGSWVRGTRPAHDAGIPARGVALRGQQRLRRKTLKTDPLFQLDAHLTRDFTENFWVQSTFLVQRRRATINGVAGEKLNNIGVGLTLGYQVNSNLNLTFGYKSTVNDSAPGDLKMDSFMVTLVYGWHPLIEGSKRLKSGE